MKLSVILVVLTACLPVRGFGQSPDFYSGFDKLPPRVKVYHYKLLQSVLQAQLTAALQKAMHEGLAEQSHAKTQERHGTVTATADLFVLPQLYIYDSRGRELFKRVGVSVNLDAELDRVFSHPVSHPGSETFSTRLRDAVPAIKAEPIPERGKNRLTLVEYWAEWCESCFAERDALEAYVQKHPRLTLDWITIDADYGATSRTISAGK